VLEFNEMIENYIFDKNVLFSFNFEI
jgi:hypothetical protein